MSKKNPVFTLGYKSNDGRKAVIQLSLEGRRLQIYAEVEGSNRSKKIGEWSQLGITLAPEADIQAVQHLFKILAL